MSGVKINRKVDNAQTLEDDLDLDKKQESEKEHITGRNMEEKILTADEVLSKIKAKTAKTELLKQVSLQFGIIGCGHAGSRIAEIFYGLGYETIVMNTATQDLTNINIPNKNKLFMDIGIQGAAKNLVRGEDATIQYRDSIYSMINDNLGKAKVLVVCSSMAGGSGAGGLPIIIELLQNIGKPIIVLAVLPMVSEDVSSKSNSLETLSKLSEFVRVGKVHNLIVVDNARIESIYEGISQMDFYSTANKAIVEPIDVFNRYSMMPSNVKALDSAEFATMLLNGEGLSIYGQMNVEDYENDIAIAEAIVKSLEGNLLASGFDLKQARFVGFMIIANKEVWNKIPAGAVNYASVMVNDTFGNPEGSYKGVYESDNSDESVKIYTFVSGLGLPSSRIDGLKRDVIQQQAAIKTKDQDRTNRLILDTGKDIAVSDVDKIKDKIKSRTKGFGKLEDVVVDRRRR